NRDISYYTPKIKQAPDQIKAIKPGRRNVDLNYIKKDRNHWKVKTYLGEAFKVMLVRSVAHYDSGVLMRIFKQNHLNALVIQLVTIILLMSIGLLTDYPAFRLPAGASILFLLSIITAIIGALTYWFSNWVITGLIALILLVNFATSHNIAYHDNKAYGLNYSSAMVPYDFATLEQAIHPELVAKDKAATQAILEKWKAKQMADNPGQLPKMVIVSSSGGGLSSATWVVHSLLTADSLLQGDLLQSMVLMTGASGGILGSAYLRELMLQKNEEPFKAIDRQQHVNNISKDLLNSITFMLVAHDLSFPWATFDYGDEWYYKDRAYIFEKQFNENTNYILDKPLGAYAEAERASAIPLLYITPAILNDGRKLYISSQGVSFMMTAPIGVEEPDLVEIDGVDFRQLFQEQDADSLRFLSALRMSATFPYILPSVHLPSQPAIEVMDAGFLDNYGLKSSIRFIQVFKDWILENTSGVVLLQISASSKIENIGDAEKKGILTSLLGPIEMAGDLFVRQEFEHNNSLGFLYDLLGKDHFHHLNFRYNYANKEIQNATISFHLTEKEKRQIQEAFNTKANQEAFQKLRTLIQSPNAGTTPTILGNN
ncbi:MAG: patatin-like phospholipase family protein, partial [Bacteroidota bacterium]